MFYFKINPIHWVFEKDGTSVYRAVELANGDYLISLKFDYELIFEIFYAKEEVEDALNEEHWIITNDKGEWL